MCANDGVEMLKDPVENHHQPLRLDFAGVVRHLEATMPHLKSFLILTRKLQIQVQPRPASYISGRMVSVLRMGRFADSMTLRMLLISK